MTSISTGTPPPPAAPAKRRDKSAMASGQGKAGWLVKGVMLALCMLWIVPTLGLVVTSFRKADDSASSGWWTAIANPFDFTQWTVTNYSQVLADSANNPGGMAQAFVNSIAVTLPATVIPILIAAFAAYAFTFMEWRGRDTMFIVVVGLLVVPNQVALVPLLQIYGQLGLNGTFAAVWLAHTGFGMPLAIFILRNYMATLPRSIVESAKVDGAGHFTTFWRLIVPMSVPALAAFAIFQFLWVWNDLLVALLFLGQGENSVATVNLASLVGNQGQGWQLLTAGGLITMLVPMFVFLTLQRYFIRGMTSGAVKG